MKTYKYIVPFIVLLVVGCSDFLTQDISEERVVLRAPFNGLQTQNTAVSFWWDTLEFADSYALEVVSPSYDSIAYVNVLVEQEGNIYDAELQDGDYQWTVIAKNSAYEAYSDTFSFTIMSDTTTDLSAQTLVLLEPGDGSLLSSNTDLEFIWETLPAATSYRWELAKPDFNYPDNITNEILLEGSHTESVIQEGAYKWRVRADNSNNGSFTYSEERDLVIDITAPDIPILTSPGNEDTLELPITLSWNSASGSDTDILEIYSDSLETLIDEQELIITNYTLNNITVDTSYYWRVKSMDEAGNESGYSEARKFWVE